MMSTALRHICIRGDGLAGTLAALALVRKLPHEIAVTLQRTADGTKTDAAFGTATTQNFYAFLLSLGLDEPDFLLGTASTFSLGSLYLDWGPKRRSWAQVYQHDLPIYDGVAFHHFITRRQKAEPDTPEVEAYLMAVQAARRGVFAHPPEDKTNPVSDMDYGYHILPQDLTRWFDTKLTGTRIKRVSTPVEADLYIDTTGTAGDWTREREIVAFSSTRARQKPSGSCRQLRPAPFGWQADTPLQGGLNRLTVCHPSSVAQATAAHGDPGASHLHLKIGRQAAPWSGNTLALGQAASCASPVTPAPMILLQADIERLVELIPVTTDMRIEAREYNRRFAADYDHAARFARALLDPPASGQAFWDGVADLSEDEKLTDKIAQFVSRGAILQYDYEPFSTTDWTLLHLGIGRKPGRYDPLTDRLPPAQIDATLDGRRDVFAKTAEKMPPHDIYMNKLLDYLRRKHG